MQTPNGWRRFKFEAAATRLADASTVWHGYLDPVEGAGGTPDELMPVGDEHSRLG
jgi:hypothetical protein